MIQLSEMFSMIGEGDCIDVATSLGLQGGLSDISIPIYEIFYLKIASSQHTQFLASSIPEANALRQMAVSCGGVCCTINLMDMDMLTLLGCLCISTPNSGMNVFIKNNIPDLANMTTDMIDALLNMAGIPFEVGGECIELAVDAVNMLFDKLLDMLENNLSSCGIALRNWEELPDFYNLLIESGEMRQMQMYRNQLRATTI